MGLSLLAYIHTYIHLKHEQVTSGTKNGRWTMTYIENVYTRHFKDIYQYITVPFYCRGFYGNNETCVEMYPMFNN